MLGIKRGDRVKIIAGKDKGKAGKVIKLLPSKKRVIVEGANIVKKHMRARSETEPGGIRDIPAPIHISNVSLICPNCGRAAKFYVKILEDGTKVRMCRRCNKPV